MQICQPSHNVYYRTCNLRILNRRDSELETYERAIQEGWKEAGERVRSATDEAFLERILDDRHKNRQKKLRGRRR